MKNKIIYGLIGVALVGITVFLICFFSIPRIDYNYDKKLDCYYVNQAYGNAKSYTILDEIEGKKVTYIDEKAFINNTKLEEVIMGKNITLIKRLAFSNCQNLKEIDLSNIITIERNAFIDCKQLDNLDLSSCLDLLGGVFFDCRNLKTISIGSVKSIGSLAFTGTAIEEISLPESLELLGEDAFYNCNCLLKIKCYSKYLINDKYLLSLGSLVEFI